MELEALKASWNKLDERLAATEIVNLRVDAHHLRGIPLCLYEHAHPGQLVRHRRGCDGNRTDTSGMETLPAVEI